MRIQLLAGFALALATAIPGAAQVLYGSLTGTVTDEGGAVAPGVSVKVQNTGTGQEFTAQTNDVGSYTFTSLPPGNYNLSIAATGFRGLTRRDIGITVNIVRREDVTLEVGQVNRWPPSAARSSSRRRSFGTAWSAGPARAKP